MTPLPLQQLRQAIAGRAMTAGQNEAPAALGVCTDTRHMDRGCAFFAIPGERFDGHLFLRDALNAGAVAAVVERDLPQLDAPPGLQLIRVPNVRKAMGRLATFVRAQSRAKVIGVGGSNGKTSTKHLIDAVLATKLRGSVSPKSFNNDIGVPLTIFPADPHQDYLVLEMGTNRPGELRHLAEMAKPDIAVITSVGVEHLEGLGDILGVRREEASITAGLGPRGLLIVNGDDPELLNLVNLTYQGPKITFGLDPTNDLFATDIDCDAAGTRFSLNGSRVRVAVPMLGRHSASNALAAVAIGRRLGLPEDVILTGLARAHAPEMRLQATRVRGITLLNDAYNANPASMRAALDTLVAVPATGRRIAVLGEMRELGDAADRYHRELGELAAALRVDALACVGAFADVTAAAAERAGLSPASVSRHPDAPAAAAVVPAWLRENDVVLVKGSRGVKLEIVADAITAGGEAARKVAS